VDPSYLNDSQDKPSTDSSSTQIRKQSTASMTETCITGHDRPEKVNNQPFQPAGGVRVNMG